MSQNLPQQLKNSLKHLVGRPTIRHASARPENYSPALTDFVANHPEIIVGDNYLPARPDHQDFSQSIKDMEPYYNFFCVDVHAQNPDIKPIFEYDDFHSGTPLRYKPFPGSVREVQRTLREKNLYWYPRTAGNFYHQQRFVEYLGREGFQLEPSEKYDGIGVENIVFTCSTTHAYYLIMSAIARPGDVILTTAPNYGLFITMAELNGFRIETVDLKEENGWLLDPHDLEMKIDQINRQLQKNEARHNFGYAPRVVAFLNVNPHNPTGKVMNHKNLDLLEQIGDVCLKKNVFIIDDLVYRDLTWDLNDLAVPFATFPKFFNNTISFFGISKAFGFASARAAAILAPAPIADGIADKLHNTMDSAPVLQTAATVGAFNASNRRYREWKKYLTPLISEYQYRYQLLCALVYGINSVKDVKLKQKIKRDIFHFEKNPENRSALLKGCPGLKIRQGTEPESGFFAVFDFTNFKGKKYQEHVIKTEIDLLDAFYKNGGIKYLMGHNIAWPLKDEMVGRISFAIDKKCIIKNMLVVNQTIRKIK